MTKEKKEPSAFRRQLQSVRNAKTMSQLLDTISWDMLSAFAFVPLLLFVLTPLYQLIRDSIDPPQESLFYTSAARASYAYSIMTVFALTAVISLLIVLIYAWKIRHRGGGRLTSALRKNKAFVWFGLFLLCAVISTCINGFTYAALLGEFYRNESLFVYILYIVGFFFCGMAMRSEAHRRVLLYCILCVSIILAVSAMIHTWIIELPAYTENVGLATVFQQFNHYAYFLLFSILLGSTLFAVERSKRFKLLSMTAFLLNTVVLIMNDTFGVYLAVFVGLIFQNVLFFCKNRKISKCSLMMLGIFLLVSLCMSNWYDTVFSNVVRFFQDIDSVLKKKKNSDSAGTGRWKLWTHTVKYIFEKPLFGFGVEGIGERLMSETSGCNDRPHNEYLQYAAFFGIPALLFYLSGLLAVFLRAWRQRSAQSMDGYRMAALVAAFGYMASACFGNTMYYTAPYFFLLLGIAYVGTVQTAKTEPVLQVNTQHAG